MKVSKLSKPSLPCSVSYSQTRANIKCPQQKIKKQKKTKKTKKNNFFLNLEPNEQVV